MLITLFHRGEIVECLAHCLNKRLLNFLRIDHQWNWLIFISISLRLLPRRTGNADTSIINCFGTVPFADRSAFWCAYWSTVKRVKAVPFNKQFLLATVYQKLFGPDVCNFCAWIKYGGFIYTSFHPSCFRSSRFALIKQQKLIEPSPFRCLQCFILFSYFSLISLVNVWQIFQRLLLFFEIGQYLPVVAIFYRILIPVHFKMHAFFCL